MDNNLIIYYMCSTHWDREWYLPFQGFRYNLVKMMDDMLEILENDKDFEVFTLDGQTIVLEDYKEIASMRSKKLQKYIKEGRVLVGPWYVMPDEFLVSGESLIRNLMVGYEVSKEWGSSPWKYGYVNDVFGHIAQMPQIFSGFGIKGTYLGRGMGNDKDISHFIWKAPDGSECIAYLGQYCGFSAPLVACNFGQENFDNSVRTYINNEIQKSDVPVVLIMHTGDHKFADKNVPAIKKRIEQLYPNATVKQVSLEEMVKQVEKYYDMLPVVNGELSKTCKNPIDQSNGSLVLVANSISSYYSLKQYNDRCQNLLENCIEPMVLMAKLMGNPLDRTYIDLAYRYLLKNQPHDSICGCSIDETHNDMIYRYAQIENICDALKYDFLKTENDFSDSQEYILTVYNFEPYTIRKNVTAQLEFSGYFTKTVDRFGANEQIDAFEIYDINGKKIPYQIINIEFDRIKRVEGQRIVKTRRYTVVFEDVIPGMGYVQYKVCPTYPCSFFEKGLLSGNDFAENEFIRLDITPFGELEIFDKKNNKHYTKLNRFIDDGENGDGWWHMPLKNDLIINSVSAPCIIEKVSDGALLTMFKITKQVSIPASFDEYAHTRSNCRVTVDIVSTVTVYANSPVIDVRTTVNNCAKDHRLRVVIPSTISSDKYFAGQAFYKIERSTKLNPDTQLYYEREMREKNMNGIIGVTDEDGCGITFVSAEGLHEGTVDEHGDITITLLRSFHKVLMQPDAQNSQLQQTLEYRYAIVPMSTNTEYSDLLMIQKNISNFDVVKFDKNPKGNTLDKKSFIEIDNKNIFSSIIKISQDNSGYIVRVFCASDIPQKANIKFNIEIKSANFTDLNECAKEEIVTKDNTVALELSPWQIVTIKVKN